MIFKPESCASTIGQEFAEGCGGDPEACRAELEPREAFCGFGQVAVIQNLLEPAAGELVQVVEEGIGKCLLAQDVSSGEELGGAVYTGVKIRESFLKIGGKEAGNNVWGDFWLEFSRESFAERDESLQVMIG